MSVADFHEDVSNPAVIQVEALVFDALQRRKAWEVEDCRPLNTFYDFTILALGCRWTVDAKYDRWIERTNRIVFEVENRYDDGHRHAKWGMNPRLDYLAVVGESMQFAYMVRVLEFRELVQRCTHDFACNEDGTPYTPPGWKVTQPRNNGYVTFGYAVPVSELTTHKVLATNLPLRPDDDPYRRYTLGVD